MDATDLCFTPAVRLAEAIRRKEVSPVDVTDAVLARIERVNPSINACVTVTAEEARRRAKQAEAALMRGDRLGLLHGVPYSLKDLTPVRGVRTTYGSRIFEHHVPSEDAVLAARLRDAGGILLGKTNTPEFGCKALTDNRVFGVTRNPWKLDRTPGGSSGGAAAAVAAGLGPIAEGSDGGGSVRIPASLSGVVGFKPSQGRIPRHPNQNAWATLSVHGPLARTVADAALMFAVMAGPDDRDPLCAGDTGEDFLAAAQGDASLRGLRVAWTPDFDGVVPVDPEVREVAEAAVRAFEDLGAAVTPASPDVRKARAIFEVVATYPRHTTLAPHLAEWREHLDPVLLRRAEHLGRFTAADVAQAEVERTALCLGMAKFFQSCDLLVLPTTAVPAFSTAGYPREVAGRPITSPYADDIWLLTMAFNLTGQPAISVPCGWTADGLPVGLQIVGRRLADALVLRAAAAFEAARPWAASRPPL